MKITVALLADLPVVRRGKPQTVIGGHCVDHGVDVPQHDFLRADSHDLRDVQRLLLVKHRVALIVVERQLVIILDGEHPAGNTGSFVRLDRQVAAGFRICLIRMLSKFCRETYGATARRKISGASLTGLPFFR